MMNAPAGAPTPSSKSDVWIWVVVGGVAVLVLGVVAAAVAAAIVLRPAPASTSVAASGTTTASTPNPADIVANNRKTLATINADKLPHWTAASDPDPLPPLAIVDVAMRPLDDDATLLYSLAPPRREMMAARMQRADIILGLSELETAQCGSRTNDKTGLLALYNGEDAVLGSMAKLEPLREQTFEQLGSPRRGLGIKMPAPVVSSDGDAGMGSLRVELLFEPGAYRETLLGCNYTVNGASLGPSPLKAFVGRLVGYRVVDGKRIVLDWQPSASTAVVR